MPRKIAFCNSDFCGNFSVCFAVWGLVECPWLLISTRIFLLTNAFKRIFEWVQLKLLFSCNAEEGKCVLVVWVAHCKKERNGGLIYDLLWHCFDVSNPSNSNNKAPFLNELSEKLLKRRFIFTVVTNLWILPLTCWRRLDVRNPRNTHYPCRVGRYDFGLFFNFNTGKQILPCVIETRRYGYILGSGGHV